MATYQKICQPIEAHQSGIISVDLRRTLRSALAGDPAEHRAVHQAGAAGIVEIEDAADQFARREQARDRRAVGVDAPARSVSILRPPKVKVRPQVTA